MVEGMNLAIHRVGIDIVCKNLESVGMHKERVLL